MNKKTEQSTTLRTLAIALLSCGVLPAQSAEDIRRARGVMDSQVVTDEELGSTMRLVEESLGLFELVSGDVLSLVEQVNRLEARFEAVRSHELMGRWLGTLESANLAWMAFPEEPEFNLEVLDGLHAKLSEAKVSLSGLKGFEEAARTGENTHGVMAAAREVVAGVQRAREEHRRRASFLAQFDAGWGQLPKEVQEGFAPEPTLAEALRARLGKLLATAHAEEQRVLDALEMEFARGRAAGVAESQRAVNELELKQRQEMSKLSRSVLEAGFRIDVQRELDIQERLVAEAAKLAVARRRREAELEASLQKQEQVVEELQEALRVSKVPAQLQRLPPEVIGRVQLLCVPGYWRPHLKSPGNFEGLATYDSLEPVPHSYSTLVAAGCCDRDPNGLFSLYVVLANTWDKERPRMKVAGWPHGTSWDPNLVTRWLQSNPEALRRLQSIQDVLIEYGSDLVALGRLRQ